MGMWSHYLLENICMQICLAPLVYVCVCVCMSTFIMFAQSENQFRFVKCCPTKRIDKSAMHFFFSLLLLLSLSLLFFSVDVVLLFISGFVRLFIYSRLQFWFRVESVVYTPLLTKKNRHTLTRSIQVKKINVRVHLSKLAFYMFHRG